MGNIMFKPHYNLQSKIGRFYKFATDKESIAIIRYTYPSTLCDVLLGTAKYAQLSDAFPLFHHEEIIIKNLLKEDFSRAQSEGIEPLRTFLPRILNFEEELPDDIQAMLILAYTL